MFNIFEEKRYKLSSDNVVSKLFDIAFGEEEEFDELFIRMVDHGKSDIVKEVIFLHPLNDSLRILFAVDVTMDRFRWPWEKQQQFIECYVLDLCGNAEKVHEGDRLYYLAEYITETLNENR